MQVLSPRAIYKINSKLFSHSKLLYIALGYAEKNDHQHNMGEEKVIF